MEVSVLRGAAPAGYGSGSGDGDGAGYGYGDGSYWAATVQYFGRKWGAQQWSRLGALQEAGTRIAFWRSDDKGLPANGGGKIVPAAPGVVHTALGPLQLCSAGTLHATLIPPKWEGERWWIVALHGDVIGDDDDEKLGCLKREIIGECL